MPDYKHDLHAVHKKPDEKPKVLHIDIETKSSAEISKSGVRRYVEDKDFAILLYAYAFDDQPVTIIDLARGEKLPDWMIEYIRDASVTKVAYNAMFERTCLSVYLGEPLSPDGWKCIMVQACYLSLPLSLEGCAEALKTVEQKDKEGHDLIRYFCVPCKPTKLNSGRTWNLPENGTNSNITAARMLRQNVTSRRKSRCIQSVRTKWSCIALTSVSMTVVC